MLNFVLCDDNEKMLTKLSNLLKIIFKKECYDAEISFSSSNPHEVIHYIETNDVNVILLDINLNSDINGLDVADRIRKYNKNIYIIFTTAHIEYAMVAYKYKTFDYIAKPITISRLKDTIDRLFEDASSVPKKYLKIDNKNTLIDENSIEYIRKDGMKLIFHSKNKDYEIYSSFTKIITLLPENFVRCHKSYIVNMNLINNIDFVINTITFKTGSSCNIGPKYKTEFMEGLNNYGNIN